MSAMESLIRHEALAVSPLAEKSSEPFVYFVHEVKELSDGYAV